ncbi:MAG: hypothetical protein WCK78_11495 [Paludibacter sp.]
MRKLVLLIAVFACVSMGSFAKGKKSQSVEMFDQNTQLIHLGIGLNSNATPVELSYEKGIKNDLFNVKGLNLGVGGYFNYFGYSTDFSLPSYSNGVMGTTAYSWNYTNIVLGARALAHYKLISQLDTYGGIMLGYDILGSTLTPNDIVLSSTNKSFIFYGGVVGVRYQFGPKLGVYLEGGSASVSNASIGISYKL